MFCFQYCVLIFFFLLNGLNVFISKKKIRNLQINLRNELLYSYIFIMYMRGFAPRYYLALYTKALILSQFCKINPWTTKAVE